MWWPKAPPARGPLLFYGRHATPVKRGFLWQSRWPYFFAAMPQ